MLKKTTIATAFLILISLFFASEGYTWGFFAHKKINRLAVFTLPPEMLPFYKKHIEFLTEHAVDPDKRRYAVEGEAQRHYIDIDHYGENPFEVVPRYWNDAVEKFTEDTLQEYGILPWHIDIMTRRLEKAFRDENLQRILQVSADIGHYIGDAHVPLHTTENYNGQLTNQKGIHGFWESRLPELKSEQYDYFVGKAKYIKSPLHFAWDIVEESHHAVDSVLTFEAKLNEQFPGDKKYSYENRGRALWQVYSEEYATAYHSMLNGMVERRMRSAIASIGSIWYTAWVNAGQPDLSKFEDKEFLKEMEEKIKREREMWKKGTVKAREYDNK